MADINVDLRDSTGGWAADVVVREGESETLHALTLDRGTHQRLAGGRATPEELLRASFEFLLEREPKESILRSFDVRDIPRYFPEYEREIARYLPAR
jgi:hypothetical protein